MKKLMITFLILIASIQNALADDVFMATSEDLKEFDKILSDTNKDVNKPAPPVPTKQTKLANPRARFQNETNKNPNDKNPPPRPFDQRPPPGTAGPGGPPPPPPPNGPLPPPPPHP
jgi:hypothetical protein